jgi:hypothetical protein
MKTILRHDMYVCVCVCVFFLLYDFILKERKRNYEKQYN